MIPLEATEVYPESELLPLSDLFFTAPILSMEFYSKLREEIRSCGHMHHPLVVFRATGAEWNKLQGGQDGALDRAPNPDQLYTCVSCGNNRGRVAKELGYTHVSCLVVDSFKTGSEYCKQMRNWYARKQGKRIRGG